MPCRLEHTYTKTNEQDWSGVIVKAANSLNSTYDPRDDDSNKVMTEQDRVAKYTKFRAAKDELAEKYIGWDREYVGDNQLNIIHYTSDVESARLLYVSSRRTHDMYEVSFKIFNENGIEVPLLLPSE